MPLEGNWTSEIVACEGLALSLRITERLHQEQTPYQEIAVYQSTDFGNVMFIDGCLMLTARDNFIYHEMMTHPALYTHAGARDVLIVGGGDCGTLQQVLRHEAVTTVTQVEIDERVTRVAEQYFPELTAASDDPRAALHFADAVAWVNAAPDASVDVVIIDSTDPIGPAEALFGAPFYAQCRRILRPGGILVQQSESPLLHLELINDIRNALADAGFGQLQTLQFPQCTYPSGWWSATLASVDRPLDSFREVAARSRNFETRYYTVEVHRGAMALPAFVRNAIT